MKLTFVTRVYVRMYVLHTNLHLSPVPDHSGSGMCPLIPVQDCLRHYHSFSFRYRTNRMSDSRAFKKTVRRWKDVHPARKYYMWWKDTLARPYC
jgi:hypothetical protein